MNTFIGLGLGPSVVAQGAAAALGRELSVASAPIDARRRPCVAGRSLYRAPLYLCHQEALSLRQKLPELAAQ